MYISLSVVRYFFFFKQKTAYELRISDLSSDVCSSDLWAATHDGRARPAQGRPPRRRRGAADGHADPRRADGDSGFADDPRHQFHRQHHDKPRDPDGRAVRIEAARFLRLSDSAVARDPVPPRPERRLDARRAGPWARG